MPEVACPKCDFVNAQATGAAMEECPKCGVIYAKAKPRKPVEVTTPAAPPAQAASKPGVIQQYRPSLAWLSEALPVGIPAALGLFGLVAIERTKGFSHDMAVGATLFGAISLALVMMHRDRKAAQTRQAQHREIINNALLADGMPFENVTFSADMRGAIGINADARMVVFYDFTMLQKARKRVPFDALLSAELYEDGQTVTVTAGGAGIGRAIVGRALFGVAGEIIGGTTGKRTSTSSGVVNRMDVRITIKDVTSPTWDICVLAGQVPRGSVVYETVSRSARTCVGALQAAIAIAADEKDQKRQIPA
jgi:hypothetical protein